MIITVSYISRGKGVCTDEAEADDFDAALLAARTLYDEADSPMKGSRVTTITGPDHEDDFKLVWSGTRP